MADNITTNPGAAGAVLATDECTVNSVANVHVPWTKLGFGTHDSFTPVTTGAGLPVQDGGGSISVDDNGASLTVDNAALSVVGGGAEATAMRVTLANDSTGVLSIDDNGSSISIDDGGNTITVDGTVAISGAVTVNSHAVTNAGTFATQVDGAALTALQLIDNIVLAEDAGHVSGDPGVMGLAVRNDSDASLCNSTLDYTPLQVDSNGYLKVNIKAGAGSGGSSAVDDAAFTAATDSGTPMMGFVSTDAVDANDVGVVRMLTNRQLAVTLHDSSGNEIAVGGGTQYDEDSVHSSGAKVTMAGVVRADTAASPATSDGDVSCLTTDSTGRLWCNVSNTVTVASHAVTNAGTFAVQAAQSGTWNITDISGTVSLPTGAATATKQDDATTQLTAANVLLGTIDGDTGTLAGCVGGTEVQVDIVAALPAGTNNIGDVDVLSVVPGTGAASLGKAIDSIAGSTDTGVATLAIRDDSLATLTPVDGDWVPLRVNSTGALHVTGGGGGTEYTEDVATPNPIVGTATMMERDDALSALTPVEGDWAAMRCDANGALWTVVSGTVAATQSGTWNVTDISGTVSLPTGASTLTEQQTQSTALSAIQTAVQLLDDAIVADDAAFTPATTKVMMAGFEFDDSATDSVNEGDAGAGRMSANRCQYVNIRDNAGNERGLNIDASGFLTANINGTVTVGSHAVTNAGTFAVQVDGSALTALQLIDDTVFTDDAAFTPATSKVLAVGMQADETSTDSVDEGDIGCPRMTLARQQLVVTQSHAFGGSTPGKLISAASTNATSVKASAGTLYSLVCTNVNAAIRYLKLFDKSSSPTVGTDTPVQTFGIPGNTAGAGIVIPIPACGIAFANGIALALTTEATDAGTTAVAANEIVVSYSYK